MLFSKFPIQDHYLIFVYKIAKFQVSSKSYNLSYIEKEILTLRSSHITRSPVQELDFVSFVYQWKLDIPTVHQGCYLIEVRLLSVLQSYKFTLVNVSTVKSVILGCFHRHMNVFVGPWQFWTRFQINPAMRKWSFGQCTCCVSFAN